MSNVIQFLETLGGSAAATHFSVTEYEATVASLEIDAGQRQALLDKDSNALSGLLGGRAIMRCLIYQTPDAERESCSDRANNDQSVQRS